MHDSQGYHKLCRSKNYKDIPIFYLKIDIIKLRFSGKVTCGLSKLRQDIKSTEFM